MIIDLCKQKILIKKRLLDEKGISTIEYIGITAVAVAIAGAIFLYLRLGGFDAIGEAAARVIDSLIEGFRMIDATR
jgi:hypothetical protein